MLCVHIYVCEIAFCTDVQNDIAISRTQAQIDLWIRVRQSALATRMFAVLFSLLGLGSSVPFLGLGSLSPFRSQDDLPAPVACVVHGTCYQGKWAEFPVILHWWSDFSSADQTIKNICSCIGRQFNFHASKSLFLVQVDQYHRRQTICLLPGGAIRPTPCGEPQVNLSDLIMSLKGFAIPSLFSLVRSCMMCLESRLYSVHNLAG